MEKRVKEIFKSNFANVFEIENDRFIMDKTYGVELIYCKEGVCYIETEELKSGEVYLLAKTTVELKCENGKVIVIFMDLDQFKRCLDEFRIYPKRNRKIEGESTIGTVIDVLLQDSENNQWNKNLLIMSHLYRLVYEITQKLSKESPVYEGLKEQGTYEKMREIIDYIAEHYSENLSLQQLAKHYNYSESAMSRFFTTNFETSFSEYYKEVRLTHAKKDLLCSQRTVSEIAMRNGFSSLRSFQRLFLKKNNMTPSAYRKNGRAGGVQQGEGK